MVRRRLFVLIGAALVACTKPAAEPAPSAGEPPVEAQATRRQLDSAVARMPVPGAAAVDRALGVLEASEARAAAHDTIR